MSERKYGGPKFANPFVRHRILKLFKQGRFYTRFTQKRPTEWQPDKVINPETGKTFTHTECWAFIEKLVRNEVPIEEIVMFHPEGATGYVMKVPGNSEEREIYIKLEIISETDSLLGRSFHYSTKSFK